MPFALAISARFARNGSLAAVRSLFLVPQFGLQGNGRVVGEMERSLWRETARLYLDDVRYSLFRDHVIRDDHVIERQGHVLARATKPTW
jgi:hypothetical protein